MTKKLTKPRQKSIGITVEEREQLDRIKARYEKITEQHCDWGQFLLAISLLGLEALQAGYKVVTTISVQHPENE